MDKKKHENDPIIAKDFFSETLFWNKKSSRIWFAWNLKENGPLGFDLNEFNGIMKPAHEKKRTIIKYKMKAEYVSVCAFLFSMIFFVYAIFLCRNRNRTCGYDVIKISQFYAEPTQKSMQLKNSEWETEKQPLYRCVRWTELETASL